MNLMLLKQTKGKVKRLSCGLSFLKRNSILGMEILINNQTHIVADTITLLAVITSHLGDNQKGLAVAVNDTVVPKSTWENYPVQVNDNILIIKATQGG